MFLIIVKTFLCVLLYQLLTLITFRYKKSLYMTCSFINWINEVIFIFKYINLVCILNQFLPF